MVPKLVSLGGKRARHIGGKDKLNLYKVLISSCVYGNDVRWNGSNKRDNDVQLWAKENNITLVPVCPENELLGTPRSPIRMMHINNSTVASYAGKDIYDDLINQCASIVDRHPDAVGFIGIANSPSCGMSVGVKSLGSVIKSPMHKIPSYPTTEISQLKNKAGRDMFLYRIHKHAASLGD